MPYKVNPQTGLIDYDKLQQTAALFKPKLIIAAVPRDRQRNNSLLMADMAHVSGLVAAQVAPNPFEYCDIVTTTTHKTLRGPRAGLIFFRKGVQSVTKTGTKIMYDLEEKIKQAVFPGLQGGPHNNVIAENLCMVADIEPIQPGLCHCVSCVRQPTTWHQVLHGLNVRIEEKVKMSSHTKTTKYAQIQEIIDDLQADWKLAYHRLQGGTDNHLVWVDLRPTGLNGPRAERVLELMSIACNKNTVPGDKSALNPGGIRLGTPALTTRGLKEQDIVKVAEFIHRGLTFALEVKANSGPTLKEFKAKLETDPVYVERLNRLREEVEAFALTFFMPGYQDI
ncbi:hypothetical protein HPB51_009691 [Rhipicephalus microplus]|uniref:Serine hydroxymethyltransferase-like domain-containing protein n=1 Tax=Rhipicephalus microplus TaxID=6941 RepID=A0A9J6ET87_RHIMP|nr:hypothetical protein HPB51_009691 [Rhipicephalus microplus]